MNSVNNDTIGPKIISGDIDNVEYFNKKKISFPKDQPPTSTLTTNTTVINGLKHSIKAQDVQMLKECMDSVENVQQIRINVNNLNSYYKCSLLNLLTDLVLSQNAKASTDGDVSQSFNELQLLDWYEVLTESIYDLLLQGNKDVEATLSSLMKFYSFTKYKGTYLEDLMKINSQLDFILSYKEIYSNEDYNHEKDQADIKNGLTESEPSDQSEHSDIDLDQSSEQTISDKD